MSDGKLRSRGVDLNLCSANFHSDRAREGRGPYPVTADPRTIGAFEIPQLDLPAAEMQLRMASAYLGVVNDNVVLDAPPD
jgi:hypothetical protein